VLPLVEISALSLLQKKKQLFSLSGNNALLEFIVDGTPQVKEYFLDSKKDVDRQLKATCELFITHATHLLISPLQIFLQKVSNHFGISTKILETIGWFTKFVLIFEFHTLHPSSEFSLLIQLYLNKFGCSFVIQIGSEGLVTVCISNKIFISFVPGRKSIGSSESEAWASVTRPSVCSAGVSVRGHSRNTGESKD